MSSVCRPGGYRPDIDGLRAVAIVSVVLFHAGLPGVAGGFTGVDVFFVISGYLITGNLLEEVQRTGRLDLANFFARRARRLMPALYLVVASTLLLGALVLLPDDLRLAGKTAQSVVTITANLFLLRHTGGYFDTQSDLIPLLHTWSLAVEEQYYVAWPLLLMLALGAAKRWSATPREGGGRLILFMLLGLLALSFAANMVYTTRDPQLAFYATPLRAWEFALGGIVQLMHRRGSGASSFPAAVGAAAGLALIAAGVVCYSEDIAFPGVYVLFPVIGTAAVIFFSPCLGKEHALVRALGSRPMVSIGRLSYSWYLWHWPLLSLGRHYNLGRREPMVDFSLATAALLLAWLTYRYVENPIRLNKPGPFRNTRGTLMTALGCSLGLVVASAGLASLAKTWGQELEGDSVAQLALTRSDLCLTSGCAGNAAGYPGKLAVWGDSHAGRFAELFAGEQEKKNLLVQWNASCPPLIAGVPYARGKVPLACLDSSRAFEERIPALASQGVAGAIVLARWNSYMALGSTDFDRNTSFGLVPSPPFDEAHANGGRLQPAREPDRFASAEVLRDGLRQTLSAFGRAGVRVLLVAPTPELTFHGPKCWAYRKTESACRLSRQQVEERRRLALSVLKEVAAEFSHVRLVDPIEAYCDRDYCYAVRDGALLYTDGNHLSPLGGRRLLEQIKPHLKWLGGVDDGRRVSP